MTGEEQAKTKNRRKAKSTFIFLTKVVGTFSLINSEVFTVS